MVHQEKKGTGDQRAREDVKAKKVRPGTSTITQKACRPMWDVGAVKKRIARKRQEEDNLGADRKFKF